jgi:hypothetical protein
VVRSPATCPSARSLQYESSGEDRPTGSTRPRAHCSWGPALGPGREPARPGRWRGTSVDPYRYSPRASIALEQPARSRICACFLRCHASTRHAARRRTREADQKMDITSPQYMLWASVYVILKWTVGLWTVRRVAAWFRARRSQATLALTTDGLEIDRRQSSAV